MRILALAAMLLLAGCLSPDDSPADPADPGTDPTTPEGQEAAGNTVVTGTGVVAFSAGGVAASQGGGEATVKEGARILYVEYAWDDPAIDLNGALSSPSAGDTQGVANIDHTADGGSPGAPDSPHSITILNPEIGTWSISMLANGAAANTEYRFAATIFYDADAVPEGYSAL